MNGGMMTKKCLGHNVLMEERHSKTKVDESGQPKAYFGHMEDGKMCFGMKEEIPENASVEETRQFGEDIKKDFGSEPSSEVEDKPMTSADWNIKGYEKSWGVFSAGARKEGGSPQEAIRDMHLWEWMDSVHGDELGYPEWKEGVNRRVNKQA